MRMFHQNHGMPENCPVNLQSLKKKYDLKYFYLFSKKEI